MKDEALCRYFTNSPAWERQLKQLRKKSLAGYSDGVIQLKDPPTRNVRPPKVCWAAGLFRRICATSFPILKKPCVPVDSPLQIWPTSGCGWTAGRCFPIRSRKRFGRMPYRHFLPPRTPSLTSRLPETGFVPWHRTRAMAFSCLHPTLKLIRTRRAGCTGSAAHWIDWQRPLNRRSWRCAAMRFSTDPHALDGQNPAGHLLLHALAYWKGRPVPSLSRDRLALYRECGLMLDDISCFTVQRGLILALPDGREHPACAQLRQQEQFCLLTSSQISALGAAFSPTGRVYLLENQMVFSTLCRQPGILHPMICTSGQLREASWQLLDLLAASGCSLYYAGDFDPEGWPLPTGCGKPMVTGSTSGT